MTPSRADGDIHHFLPQQKVLIKETFPLMGQLATELFGARSVYTGELLVLSEYDHVLVPTSPGPSRHTHRNLAVCSLGHLWIVLLTPKLPSLTRKQGDPLRVQILEI